MGISLAAVVGATAVATPDRMPEPRPAENRISSTTGSDVAEVFGPSRQMEQADLLEECMLDQGFPAVRQGIAVGFRVPPAQREQYEAAVKVCSAMVDHAFPEPPALIGADFYEALVDAAECLRGLGYAVSEPPSLDRFLESLAAGGPPWSPYLDLPDSLTQGEWNTALAACPQPIGR